MTRWLIIFALCLPVSAQYFAQSSQGSANGRDCADAYAISTLSSHFSWSPGNTLSLCFNGGNITGTAGSTLITATGSGTSGNPITIQFVGAATLAAPYWAQSGNGVGCGGAISICGQSYIVINGGGSGVIENTANGDSLANQHDSTAIDAYTCANCTVENLTIQNIYVHPQNGLSSPDQTQMNCIAFSGSGWTITGNTMSNVGWCLKEAYGNGDSGTTITNNNISLMDHGWMLATSSANSFTNAFFSGNQIHDTYNWDTSGCAYHHDGIHTFGTSGSTMSGINVYNNYFYGNWGSCPTGFIFVEGGGSSTPSHMLSSAWWNNVFLVATSGAIVNTNGWFGLFSGDSGTQQVYNNTAIGSGANDNTLCVGLEDLSGLVYKNNTISGCGDPVNISSTTITAADYNVYGAVTCGNGGNCFIWNGSFTGSFSAWKTACSCDSHSISNLTPNLNSNGSPQASFVGIREGANLASISTGSLASLANDTSLGDTRTPNARPGVGTCTSQGSLPCWDIGAYQYVPPAASTPTFSPVAGTYSSPQVVTISTTSSGAIICWNTTGAPATNGASGCTTGTKYTGPVVASTNSILYAVAGGTGYTDSLVGSASYTIGNFVAYDGIDVIPLTSLPSLALSNGLNNGDTVYDTSYLGHTNFDGSTFSNSANLSPVTRLTDANSASNSCASVFSAGQGGSAEFPLSNTNTSLVGVGCGGFEYVGVFNTTTGQFTPINSGVFITTDHNIAGGGSSTVANDFGAISFSLTDPGMLFSLGIDATDHTVSGGFSPTAFYPYPINYAPNTPLSGFGVGYYQSATTSGGIVDFKYGLPAQFASNCASTHYNPGDYCIHPLSTAEMATSGAWATGHVYVLGDILVSQSGPACMYVLQTASGSSTTGSSPIPAGSSPCSGNTVTDATGNVFRGTRSLAQFVVENTGTAGTSVASGFVITAHPDMLSTFTDTCSCGIIWTFTTPAFIPTTANNWVSIAGVSNDSGYVVGGYSYPTKWSVGISVNNYGSATEGYNKATGIQGTGTDLILYDATLNAFQHLNTVTGYWTQVNCGSGNGFTCGSETQTQIGSLNAITNTGCGSGDYAYFIHNLKGSPSATAPFGRITAQTNFYGCSVSGANHYQVWNQSTAAFNATSSLQNTFAGFNHSAIDNTIMVAYNGSAAPGGGNSGWFTSVYQNGFAGSQPGVSTYLAPGVNLPTCNAISGICSGTPPFGCYTNSNNPECDLGNTLDSHLSCVGGCDHGSFHACGTSYNLATLGPQFNAWQNQETCYATAVIFTPPAAAPSTSVSPVYGFTHTGCTGTNLSFNIQFCISQWSQDGNWLFWGSDYGCGLGSTTGSAPTVWSSGTYVGKIILPYVATPPQSTTLFSLCGYPWAAGYAYSAGALINPIENTSGSGGVDDVYQAVAVTGAAGPQSSLSNNQPKCGTVSCWTLTNPPTATTGGDYVCDNTSGTGDTVSTWPTLPTCTTGIIWEDMGPQTPRSDVFAVKLIQAVPIFNSGIKGNVKMTGNTVIQ